MPRGDKSKYTDKQKRQAEHIEEGYEQRGVSEGEAERRAWAYPGAEKRADRVKASPPTKVRRGKVAGWAGPGRPLAQRQRGPPPPRRRQRRARGGPNSKAIGA